MNKVYVFSFSGVCLGGYVAATGNSEEDAKARASRNLMAKRPRLIERRGLDLELVGELDPLHSETLLIWDGDY